MSKSGIERRFDRYVAAIWSRYGLLGFVIIVAVLAFLAWFFQIDVAGGLHALVNWNS